MCCNYCTENRTNQGMTPVKQYKDTADKMLPKAKKKIFMKWLTGEALNLADERREAKKKGNDEEYRRWEAGKQHCMGERGRTGAEYTIKM